MALSITKPSGQVPCDCNDGGKVCVQGAGAIRNGQAATKVYVQIMPAGSSCAGSPPAGASSVTPDSSGNWSLGRVPGASYSSNPPYPSNRVCVWAEYPQSSSSSSSSSSGGSVTYESTSNLFTAQCSASVPCS
jgi:hypothetical protein